jgi:alpha-galactosidase
VEVQPIVGDARAEEGKESRVTKTAAFTASRRAVLAYAASAFGLPAIVRAAAIGSAKPPSMGGRGGIRIEFDTMMRTRILSQIGGSAMAITGFDESEFVVTDKEQKESLFVLTDARSNRVRDQRGQGMRHVVRGEISDGLEKTVTVTIYDSAPTMAAMRVSYRNISRAPVAIKKWVSGAHLIPPGAAHGPTFWSWHGASHEDRRDWILPVDPGFEQRNFMGMNASDYGGGTPIVDVWRRDAGLAVGHLETVPKLVALPVAATASGASLHLEFEALVTLAIGQSVETFETFVSVHHGDCFATLTTYRDVMAMKGLEQGPIPLASYEPVWCAWGYDRNFNTQEIIDTLPKAKALGLEWAGLDDGWQTAEGDWNLDRKKFPRGDADMAAFSDAAKKAGLKPKLWIAPLAVDPGTDLLHDHTDMLLLDKDGAVQDVTWWNAFTLCPAYQPTIDNARLLIRKILTTWGYEGLKLDGQHLNGVAPCYNPAHKHARPEESVEKLQLFWKAVHDEARAIKPDVVIEICPCGTSQSFFNMAYQNQAVGSDPLSSWQVRLKGKTLKALMGPQAPYCGDHVELSDGGNDFASSVGIGAVVATKFALPGYPIPEPALALTPDKEKIWAKWIALYREKMLSTGTYRGALYDIGFDKPEGHAVEKDGVMHYAFFATRWTGPIELRGLKAGRYTVTDYVNSNALAEVTSAAPWLDVTFTKFLLIEARPKRV